MASSLGTRIAEYRKNLSLTQDQLAEKMGVSAQAVSKWENDLSCPDIAVLPQLADLFGITIDTLLRGEQTQVRLVPTEQRNFDKLLLRIMVRSSDGDIVNVNLPLPLLKVCIEMGMSIPEMGGKSDALKDVDFAALLKLAESGAIGKLVEVISSDGDTVDIVIE